jgi:hypothetical protein
LPLAAAAPFLWVVVVAGGVEEEESTIAVAVGTTTAVAVAVVGILSLMNLLPRRLGAVAVVVE